MALLEDVLLGSWLEFEVRDNPSTLHGIRQEVDLIFQPDLFLSLLSAAQYSARRWAHLTTVARVSRAEDLCHRRRNATTSSNRLPFDQISFPSKKRVPK